MKKAKVVSYCLAGLFFVESSMAGSLEDIERAYKKTGAATCDEQEGLLQQLDETYNKLNEYEISLKKAHMDRPYVEYLQDIRNTAGTMTVAAGLVMAVGMYRLRVAKEGQYSLPVTALSSQIAKSAIYWTGAATTAGELGYVLTNDEVARFGEKVKRTKELILSLREQLRNCR